MGHHKEGMVREKAWLKRVCFKWYLQGSPCPPWGLLVGGSSYKGIMLKPMYLGLRV